MYILVSHIYKFLNNYNIKEGMKTILNIIVIIKYIKDSVLKLLLLLLINGLFK